MAICGLCGNPTTEQTSTLIPSHVVNRCRPCNAVNVQGSKLWPTIGPGVMKQLIGSPWTSRRQPTSAVRSGIDDGTAVDGIWGGRDRHGR